MKVLLKPNLLMKRRPEEFTTTHPVVAGAVIRVLKEQGITDIVIADSPGGPYTKPLLSGIYRAAGFTGLALRYGITVNEETGYREKTRMENSLCKQFYLIDPVLESDYIIDLCKFKTHGMVGLSGAVKNLFGCVPGLMKPELHFRFPEEERFCEMLVDLCETVRPNLTIVDAVDSMQGDGPSGGSLLHTGMLLAGKNPYDIDLLLCKVAGFDPDKIYTVRSAKKRGLSACSVDELTPVSYTHLSIAEIDGMRERTVVINGFSKSFSMTGWRLGYACGPREIIKQMTKLHQFAIMCAPTTSQYAAIEALKNCDDSVREMRDDYNARRRLVIDGFTSIGLPCFEPEGAFYIFPSIQSTGLTSDEFCERLLYSKKVAVVPGNAFGESGEGFIRVSYSYSKKHLLEAIERIGEFMEELAKEREACLK